MWNAIPPSFHVHPLFPKTWGLYDVRIGRNDFDVASQFNNAFLSNPYRLAQFDPTIIAFSVSGTSARISDRILWDSGKVDSAWG